MKASRNMAYLKAKKKVEALKGFYGHLIAYIIVNTFLIIMNSGLFSNSEFDLLNLRIYSTAFFWGIGLAAHGIYLLFIFNFKNNFIQRWEEKKIDAIIRKQEEEDTRHESGWH